MTTHGCSIVEVRCDAIQIGERHRQDMGDLGSLAASIATEGLLQPIGVTEDDQLVFGERRLRAVHEVLKQDRIAVRVVHVRSITAGEYAENEIRKDFTSSERVAIGTTLESEVGDRRGQRTDRQVPEHVPELDPTRSSRPLVENIPQVEPGVKTRDIVAKAAGFGNARTYEQAKKVVEKAVDEVIAQMDSGEMSIHAAAIVADETPERQREIASMPEGERREAVRKLRQKDLPTPTAARKLALESGKAILDRKLQWQTGMSPEEREPLIEKSHAIVAVIDAMTALTACPLSAPEVAFGIRDLDTPDMNFVGRCRKAAAFLYQVQQELSTHENK